MTAALVLRQLMSGIQTDLAAYERLEAQLEAQFAAIARCDAGALDSLAAELLQLTGVLEASRRERERLLHTLLGPSRTPSMQQLFGRLPAELGGRCQLYWDKLCVKVGHCRQMNVRNGKLMSEQHVLLSRLMFGDEDVYVPA
ncbi:flagellar export chaperone FlgN [Craterilacuibacter sp.]|uniref:flagellar export chaperone FlgN n=1 Tax=Craterilacuibacter sp. TaxID=2870909 RepID=UPI003F3826FB